MNRPLARRAGPFLVALTGLLLTAAGTAPRGQGVATPRQAPWPTPALPDGPIALQSAENRFVYIWYHKPVPTGRTLGNARPELAGESTLARGVWDGSAITNRTDIFATGATGTESSRMTFGRDGMIYMTVSENPGAVLRLEPIEATTTG